MAKRPECLLGGSRIGKLSQRLHAKFHVRDGSGRNEFDLGRGDPARADPSTLSLLVNISVGRNAVADRVLANVPILQVSDALIGVDAGGISLFGGQSANVRTGDEGFGRLNFQAGLKDEPGVANLVGLEGSRGD